MLHELIDSYNNTKLTQAAKHWNGAGMGGGVDFATTFALDLTKLLKRDCQRKAALDTVGSGACWSQARTHSIRPEVSDLCPRCNLEIDADLHTYWNCPCNLNIEHDFVINTQKYKDRANNECMLNPCLWL